MVSMDYPPRVGGLAAHVYELSHALRRGGHSISVLTRSDDVRAVQDRTKEPDPDEICPERIALRRLWMPQGIRIQRAIDRMLGSSGYDLVHLHGLKTLEHCPKRSLPQVFTNHTSGFLARMKRGGWRRSLLARRFARMDMVLAPSEELTQLPGSHPPPERCIYIPNGIRVATVARDAEKRKALRSRLQLKKDRILAIVTRRLVPKNGVIHLARALAHTRNQRLFLLLIGDGPERSSIEKELAQHMPGRHLALGSMTREALLPWYSAADFAVLPSLMEATSISGLEAMAASLPLVGTAVGGIPDLIEEGKNGFLVPAADERALAGALDAMADADFVQMGACSRKKAAEFDWDRIAERTAEHYRSLLKH